MLFFPPFAKSRTDGRKKKKILFVGLKNMKKNWHTLFFICYITLFFIIPTTTTFRTSHTKTHKNTHTHSSSVV